MSDIDILSRSFLNNDGGCDLCHIRLIKGRSIHLNSKKHQKNIIKWKLLNNLLPPDEKKSEHCRCPGNDISD